MQIRVIHTVCNFVLWFVLYDVPISTEVAIVTVTKDHESAVVFAQTLFYYEPLLNSSKLNAAVVMRFTASM